MLVVRRGRTAMSLFVHDEHRSGRGTWSKDAQSIAAAARRLLIGLRYGCEFGTNSGGGLSIRRPIARQQLQLVERSTREYCRWRSRTSPPSQMG
jgi:hypothetical protein